MYNNKFMLAVFGENRSAICERIESIVDDGSSHSVNSHYDIFINQLYDTGIPDKPVWNGNVALQLHGIAFPWDVSLDDFAQTPEQYLQSIIDKYRNDLKHIALGFRNGSYAGIVVDENDKSVYAFTSFLNSIPLYYSLFQGCLIISTDFYLLAYATHSELSELSPGLIEYYVQGTNLSDNTAFSHIKAIPKGAYLKFFKGSIAIDYYYTMPNEETTRTFDDCVEEFSERWGSTIESLTSTRFKFGLGLTGGLDSRLILSAMPDRSEALLYTGSHPLHPDYLLARHITDSLGLKNHVLEDYRNSDKLKGYAEYSCLSDYPLNSNSLMYFDQVKFRIEHQLVYELGGGINLYGGIHYYQDRRSIKDTIKRSFCLPSTTLDLSDDNKKQNMVNLILRSDVLNSDFDQMGRFAKEQYAKTVRQFVDDSFRQLGNVHYMETYLERMRHIYKSMNLLSWNLLPSRRYVEHIMPDMNIELTDFACKVPLKFRDSRKMLLAYLNRYHPKLAKFVLSGYTFSAASPWILYKTLSPYITALNHLGFRVPFLQWYIRKHDYLTIDNMPEIYRLQKSVCLDSHFISTTPLAKILETKPDNRARLIRLYNMAILEKRLLHGEDGLRDYLLEKVEEVRRV